MCDRPANDKGVTCEIEVTPEMIEAGLSELAGFDWQECAERADQVVVSIWRAMASAANQTSGKTL
jgi:hypothetical protein